MLDSLRLWPKIRARVRSGPFGAYVAPYVATLVSAGYSSAGVRKHVYSLDVLGRWSTRHGLSAQAIDRSTLDRFAARFRRRRSPSHPTGRASEVVGRARHFVAFLRERGVVPPDAVQSPVSPKDLCLRSFGDHLVSAKGLSTGTRGIYLRFAGELIDDAFGSAVPDWSRVGADDIAEFVCRRVKELAPSGCRSPVSATRAFLRYLAFTGAVRPELAHAVPTIREWKHAGLPKHLSRSQVASVLAGCTGETPSRRRDRAILLVLSRLGLRAFEVANLRLDDIDWRQGRLTVRAGKTDRPRFLPMPNDVGRALASYLKGDRRRGQSRSVFLRSRPPLGPLSANAVGCVASRALRRAGVAGARLGAHVFRHTAATEMVRRGASFKEVADVLGHARLDTTAIYAKLDLETLRGVALPWLGGA